MKIMFEDFTLEEVFAPSPKSVQRRDRDGKLVQTFNFQEVGSGSTRRRDRADS